jgi:DNA-damage-inducible protein D
MENARGNATLGPDSFEEGSMRYDAYVRELERLRRTTVDDVEFWTARDLQGPLGYDTWRRFAEVIARARQACESACGRPTQHFAATGNVITAGHGAQLERADWFLTRYACYLIAMNADSTKPEAGYAQTYFAIQTRRQEKADHESEIDRRFSLRARVRQANKGLNSAAKGAGVQRFAIFHDAGIRALYGGQGKSEILVRKGIAANEDWLNRFGSTELAAHYFRITQAEERLNRDHVRGEAQACDTHARVGREVRAAMKRSSGVLPEDLPAAPPLKRALKKTGAQSPPLLGDDDMFGE